MSNTYCVALHEALVGACAQGAQESPDWLTDLFPKRDWIEHWTEEAKRCDVETFGSTANLAAWFLFAIGEDVSDHIRGVLIASACAETAKRERRSSTFSSRVRPTDDAACAAVGWMRWLSTQDAHDESVYARTQVCWAGFFACFHAYFQRIHSAKTLYRVIEEDVHLPRNVAARLMIDLNAHGVLDAFDRIPLSVYYAFYIWPYAPFGAFDPLWFDVLQKIHKPHEFVDWHWFLALWKAAGEEHRTRLLWETRGAIRLSSPRDRFASCWCVLHTVEHEYESIAYLPTAIEYTGKNRHSTFVSSLKTLIEKHADAESMTMYLRRELDAGRRPSRWLARAVRVLLHPQRDSYIALACALLSVREPEVAWEVERGLGYLEFRDIERALERFWSDQTSWEISKSTALQRLVRIFQIQCARNPDLYEAQHAMLTHLRGAKPPNLKPFKTVLHAHTGSPWFEAEEILLRAYFGACPLRERDPTGVFNGMDACDVLQNLQTTPCHDAHTHIILHAKHPAAVALYERAVRTTPDAHRDLHVWAMGHVHKKVRDAAVRLLSFDADASVARDVAVASLKASKASERGAAARILANRKDSQALAAVQDALDRERAASVRSLLQRAATAMAPEPKDAPPKDVWSWRKKPSVNVLLERLRTLVHTKPTRSQWVRLCDLIERFHRQGEASWAIEYLQDGQHPVCLHAHCSRPWGWGEGKRKALGVFGHEDETSPPWVPLATVLDRDAFRSYINHGLGTLRLWGSRKRLDTSQAIDLVRDRMKRTWAFCEAYDLPLTGIHVRVDGGKFAPRSHTIGVGSVQVLDGFHVVVVRASAKRVKGGSNATEVVAWACKVPRKHPIRDHNVWGPCVKAGRISLLGYEGPLR